MSDDDGGGRDFRRLGRGFGGDNEDEDLETDVLRPEGKIGYFSSKSVPAGMELEIALMREERERDKTINKEDSHVVDRRVWENHEIGVGYQHKTVVRQPQAQHHTVKVKDLSAGGKKRKEDGGEDGDRSKKRARKQGGGMDEEVVGALKKLRALITIELRRRAKAMARIKGSTTTTTPAAAASHHGANGGGADGLQGQAHAEVNSDHRDSERAVDKGGGGGGDDGSSGVPGRGGGGDDGDNGVPRRRGNDARGGAHRDGGGRVKRPSERRKDVTAPSPSPPPSSSSSLSSSDSDSR